MAPYCFGLMMYKVTVTTQQSSWLIAVPQISREIRVWLLTEVESATRALISQTTGLDEDSFELDYVVVP